MNIFFKHIDIKALGCYNLFPTLKDNTPQPMFVQMFSVFDKIIVFIVIMRAFWCTDRPNKIIFKSGVLSLNSIYFK